MNLLAFFDGVLAAVALWVAWGPGRNLPAVRLGAALLAAAAVLGTLRFSGLLPLPQLHQSMSMFAAGVGLPLLGVAVVWPQGGVALQPRFVWSFAIAAAVLCILIVVMAEFKLWTSITAVLAVLAIGVCGLWRRQWWGVAAAVCMLVALLGFAAKIQLGPLAPGDVLHIGLALGLVFYAGRLRTVAAATPTSAR